MYVCTYVGMYVCLSVCISIYLSMHLCIYVSMYVYLCLCMCLRVENRTSVLHLFMSFMGLTGWGGVGWDNNVHWHFLTYMMLRYCVGWGGVG